MYRDKIYKKDSYYTFLRPLVDFFIKSSYRWTDVRGKENIPEDGAVIISPNHCNTLMDALVILRAFKDQTVFGARADLFNKPLVAKIMYFIRILPMVRQRDGLRNVLKNHETQETIVETLENKVRFCVFPEGRHSPAHSLQPLGKGVFRAALAANEKFGDKFPVYIVPTGLEYGDYFRYRSTSLVNFGKPINVTEFVREHPVDNEVQLIEPLRRELASRMSELITYIKDDEQFDGKWALTKILAAAGGERYNGPFLYDDMLLNRKIIAEMEKKAEDKVEEMNELFKKAEAFEKERRKEKISIYSFRKKILDTIGSSIISIVGFIFWICEAVASFPIWLTYYILRSKVKDRAFHNTVAFGSRLVFGIILGLLYMILAICLKNWWIAIFALPAISGGFFDYMENTRIFFSDIRLMGKRKLKESYSSIIEEYYKL